MNELIGLPGPPADWFGDALPGDVDWLDSDALSLSGDEVSRFNADRVLDTLATARRLRAKADALEAHALHRLNALRDGARGTADEAAFELRTTRHQAAARIARAERLIRRHPTVLAAMERGDVEGYVAGRITDITAALPDDLARDVDARLAGKLTGHDPTLLRRAARRAVLAVDPDGEHSRARQARRDRRVELVPGENSMSTLYADLPAEDAAAAYTSIDGAARALRRDGETRTLDQLRADVLAERLIGTSGGKAGAVVFLHMPLGTALSITDDGCELDGYGPISGPIARQIMADEHSVWRKVICDPASGAPLDIGRTRYRPSAAIRDFVNVRDRECGTPNCHRPAKHSDFDHLKPRAKHGVTSAGNGGPKCEHHNNLKEHPDWTLKYHPDTGTATITTPAGRVYTKTREPIYRRSDHQATAERIRARTTDRPPPADDPPY